LNSKEVKLNKIDKYVWEIPKDYKPGMRVPARVYADEDLLAKMKSDMTLEQSVNVAHLPGICKWSITLPDGHEGYGFPIGGVAATNLEDGVISPGGVGYDINCGARLISTKLSEEDLTSKLSKLLDNLFTYIPSGLGSRGKIKVSSSDLEKVIREGARWAIDKGYGWDQDAAFCEENGCMEGADPDKVSNTAKTRGAPQLGSLGSGNHFVEIDKIEKIYNQKVAKMLNLESEGQIVILIHTGSRGFGHQVCGDYIKMMERAVHKYRLKLPDRQLACAPLKSSEAENYLPAMAAACNFAWANRQMITHWTREVFEKVFKKPSDSLGMRLIYDVAHNIAKIEEHTIEGKHIKVCVHRKGATRAFPPAHPKIPVEYHQIGQPVFLPGSMGTGSWVLIGTQKSMEVSFGSTAHGAGRVLSRSAAKRRFWGGNVKKSLENKGIQIRAASMAVISEETPDAYKDVDRVAEISDHLGIATKVARLKPLGVTKG
jgi:tRNA-splicing ligase RtcB